MKFFVQRTASTGLQNVPSHPSPPQTFRLTPALLTILLTAAIATNLFAREPTWTNYTDKPAVAAVAVHGDLVWVGMISAGLVKINRKTGEKTFFTVANSDLPENHIRHLSISAEGAVQITTSTYKEVTFDGKVWSATTPSNFIVPARSIQDMSVDELSGFIARLNIRSNWNAKHQFSSIALGKDSSVWIGTDTVLYRFNGSVVTTYSSAREQLQNPGTHGVVRYDGTNWANGSRMFSGFPAYRISWVTSDNCGTTWIGSGCGIVRFDGLNWRRYISAETGFDPAQASCVAVDIRGNLWVGYNQGFAEFNGFSWKKYEDIYPDHRVPDYQKVTSIAADPDGGVWIGSYCGLVKHDGKQFTRVTLTTSPLDGHAHSFTMDAEGNMWCIVAEQSLGKFDGKKWSMYHKPGTVDKYRRSSFTCLAIDKAQNKWIGTGNGLVKFDGKTWHSYKAINSDMVIESVHSIAIDARGIVWTGIKGTSLSRPEGGGMTCPNRYDFGLVGFDGTAWILRNRYGKNFPYATVSHLATAPDGSVWMGAYESSLHTRGQKLLQQRGGKLTTYAVDTLFPHFRKRALPKSIVNSFFIKDVAVSNITFDKKGTGWIGSTSGIAKFDGRNWTTYDSTNSPLRNGFAHYITIDQSGNRWIGTSYALIKFTDTSWASYTTENSDFPGSASKIVIDKGGRKWFETLSGWTIFDDSGDAK